MLAGIFLFCTVATLELQLLAAYYVGLLIRFENYQPYDSSFTQLGTNTILQQYRIKACVVPGSNLSLCKVSACATKWQIIIIYHKTVKTQPLISLPVTTGMSLNDSHCTVSLTALTLTARRHMQTHTQTHTSQCYPCCFQNVSSAWAVLIVLIVMNFLYIQWWILLLLLLLLQPLLFCTLWEGAD